MKVLILFASFGDGHLQAANALLEEFAQYSHVQTASVDPFRGTSRLLARINELIYEWSTKYVPILYGLSYDLTNHLSLTHPLWKVLALFSRKATWTAVRRHQPDVIIQLFPDHALAKLPPLQRKPIIVAVLTDYSVHVRWFHRNIEHYFLPCLSSAKHARKYLGDKKPPITVCGIPIRSQFSYSEVDGGHRKEPYIVVSAGGRGVFPDLRYVIEKLTDRFEKFPIVVMCGRNEAMQKEIEALAIRLGNPSQIQAIGFVDDVASLLNGAHFVVAKAGGISISESLACGAPMLFYKPLAGQEKHNAEIVESMGAGRVAVSRAQLVDVFRDFTGASLTSMRAVCKVSAFPHASQSIVDGVLSLVKSSL